MSDIERRCFESASHCQTVKHGFKKWMMTMLAEIFLLRLEALLRVAAIDLRAASSDPRFVPVMLPRR